MSRNDVNIFRIKVEIEEAQAALRQLEALASEIRGVKGSAEQLGATLSTCWQGESGTAIQDYITRWIAEQESLASTIESDVAEVRKRLQNLVDRDQLLAELISV